jgi:hypothetical protein
MGLKSRTEIRLKVRKMARWQFGERYEQRAAASLSTEDCERARRFLSWLSLGPPHLNLDLKPVDGYDGMLWECRAGGKNKCILRRANDEIGELFIVEDVGPY